MQHKLSNLFYGVLFLPLLLLGCGEQGSIGKNKVIEGTVLNIFGRPIEGATVSIVDTQFIATTDSAGQYQLDYVPGEFSVVAEKDGLISSSFTLNIAEKLHFPASPTSLIPKIPEEMIIVADIQNSKISMLETSGAYQKNIKHADGHEYARYVELNPDEELPIFKAGELSFLDSFSGKNSHYLFMLKADNKYFSDGFSKSNRYLDGALKGEVTKHGDVKLHRFELQPGKYAWVKAAPNYKGRIVPADHKKQTIYAFSVE